MDEVRREEGDDLGKNILGTDFSFDIKVKEGAGAFVCGESSALRASIEGLPGDTLVCCAHEYTVANLTFACDVEPENTALAARLDEARSGEG